MGRQLVRRCSRNDRRDHYRRPGSGDQGERVCHGERRRVHTAGEGNTPRPASPAHQDGGDNPERDKDPTGDESIHTGISKSETDNQPDGRTTRDDPSSCVLLLGPRFAHRRERVESGSHGGR